MMFGKKPATPLSAPAPAALTPPPAPMSTAETTSNAMVAAAAAREKARKRAMAAGGLMLPGMTPGQQQIRGVTGATEKPLGA